MLINRYATGEPCDTACTPGFADPQYLNTHIFSEASDVYSFGLVMFELMLEEPVLVSNAAAGDSSRKKFLWNTKLQPKFREDVPMEEREMETIPLFADTNSCYYAMPDSWLLEKVFLLTLLLNTIS